MSKVSKVLLQSAIATAESTRTYKTADALFKEVAKASFAQKENLTPLQLLQLAVEYGCTCKSVSELKLPEVKERKPANEGGTTGTGRKGREKLIVDEAKLREVIADIEDKRTFDKLNDLWNAVAETEWAKAHTPRPLSASVVYQRVQEFGIETKTKPARNRTKSSDSNEIELTESVAPNADDGVLPTTREVTVRVNDAMSIYNSGIRRFRNMGLTVVPAGACPHKLTATDEATVEAWCRKVVATMAAQRQQIAPSGLQYFARQFYDIFSEDYKTVSENILACKHAIYSGFGPSDEDEGE